MVSRLSNVHKLLLSNILCTDIELSPLYIFSLASGTEPGEEDERPQRHHDGGAQPFIQPRLSHVSREAEKGREVHPGECHQRGRQHQQRKQLGDDANALSSFQGRVDAF